MAKEVAPTCEVTGLPLPILPPGPRENGAYLFPHLPYFPDNNHHAWFNENWLKKQGLGGAALQASRIQNIDWYYHKNYHDIFYKGPKMPRRKGGIFRLGVLAAAGVIPRQAVDVGNRGEYEIVELTEEQHRQIGARTSIDNKKPLAKFLADYATRQNIAGVVDELIIEQFLDSRTDSSTKMKIARSMLSSAIDLSFENLGLHEKQQELKAQGLFTDPKPRTLYWTAKQLVRLNYLDYFSDRAANRLTTT